MNPKRVTSPETSMKLKEAGVPQVSECEWVEIDGRIELWNDDTFVYCDDVLTSYPEILCSAFLSDELGEMLTQYAISTNKCIWHSGIEKEKRTQYTPDGKELVEKEIVIVHTCSMFSADGKGFGWICEGGENDREARAKMLLYLIEHKLISFEAKASESEGHDQHSIKI